MGKSTRKPKPLAKPQPSAQDAYGIPLSEVTTDVTRDPR